MNLLLFITFLNISLNHSFELTPYGDVRNVYFNISLPPTTWIQKVYYPPNYLYSEATQNYFIAEYIKDVSSPKTIAAASTVVRTLPAFTNATAISSSYYLNSQLSKYLLPSDGIESGDVRIVQLAKKITNNSIDIFDKLERITSYVYTNISYDINTLYSSQSALSTLLRGSGVCEGKTRLFVALARASGIPARYVSGLGIQNSQSFSAIPHAWAEVYLGKWVEVDPTWFEAFTLSAGHIMLEREGFNNSYHWQGTGSLDLSELPLNKTFKINKMAEGSISYNITSSFSSLYGNGKGIVILSVPNTFSAVTVYMPVCTGLFVSKEEQKIVTPFKKNIILEINGTNTQGSWTCSTYLVSNLLEQKKYELSISPPGAVKDFDLSISKNSIPYGNDLAITITPQEYDTFIIADSCTIKKVDAQPLTKNTFYFRPCSNTVYVASSQTFKKINISFLPQLLNFSVALPKEVVAGNNFTGFLRFNSYADSNYFISIKYGNSTKPFFVNPAKNRSISFLFQSDNTDFINITVDNGAKKDWYIFHLNVSNPSFNISEEVPQFIVLYNNFTIKFDITTNSQSKYFVNVIYSNFSANHTLNGNSSFSQVLYSTPNQNVTIKITTPYNYTFSKTLSLKYILPPKVVINIKSKGERNTGEITFYNYSRNIVIKIGNLSWYFPYENNTSKNISFYGYGKFLCSVSFEDVAGNKYFFEFNMTNSQNAPIEIGKNSQYSFLLLIVLGIVILIVIYFLRSLKHR